MVLAGRACEAGPLVSVVGSVLMYGRHRNGEASRMKHVLAVMRLRRRCVRGSIWQLLLLPSLPLMAGSSLFSSPCSCGRLIARGDGPIGQ